MIMQNIRKQNTLKTDDRNLLLSLLETKKQEKEISESSDEEFQLEQEIKENNSSVNSESNETIKENSEKQNCEEIEEEFKDLMVDQQGEVQAELKENESLSEPQKKLKKFESVFL